MNPSVYLLARITNQSKEDFVRWCKYHAVIGLRKIYIFSSFKPDWYDDAKKELIETVPELSFIKIDSKWLKISEIIRSFCRHCVNGDWGIFMNTDEWLFSNKGSEFDIRKLVSYSIQRQHAHAVTIYKEYAKKTDTGFISKSYSSYSNSGKLPVASTVLFSVQDVNANPLSGPNMPSDRDLWIDTCWEKMNQNRLISEIPEFSKYAVRIIKVVSDDEITESNDGSNFTVANTSFTKCFSEKFPEVFSSEIPESKDDITEKTPAKKEATEADIPFDDDGAIVGHVLTGILLGMNLSGISSEMKNGKYAVDESVLNKIYEREARNVIRDNVPYRTLLDMMNRGSKQKDIIKEIHVSPKTLKKMKGVLESIPAEIKNEFSSMTPADSENKEEEIGKSSTDEM